MLLVPTISRNNNFSKVLDGFFDDLFDSTSNALATPSKFPVDVETTEKGYVVKAELPGMDKKDIQISVKEDVLTISAERKEERKKGSYYERCYGKFERSFSLDGTISKDDIEAEYKDGILSIVLCKAEPPKKDIHKIDIR